MADLILNTVQNIIDFKQLEVKPNTVIAIGLPMYEPIPEDLMNIFDNAFGDEFPYIVIAVDDVDRIRIIPENAMRERGWQPFEVPETWIGKLIFKLGYVKVKE